MRTERSPLGTAHLLLALLTTDDGWLAPILEHLGLEKAQVREHVMSTLGEPGPET